MAMVHKQNRNWQKRSRKSKDNAQDAEERHDVGNQGNEKQEMAVPKRGVTILEMTVQQFTSLFMNGYRVAKEEGFSEKDAEDFGIFAATRFAALWMEDRLAQKKEAEQIEERKEEEVDDHDEENDDE
jgi:hypothetical protein